MAAEDLLRTHPFAFKKDSTLGPASITTATSLAVHSAERGEGCAIIIFAPENRPIYRVTILHVTRYQLMIWMGTSGRLILPDGLCRCDREWFAVTRDARQATPLHLQRPGVQRVAPSEVSEGDASLAACNASHRRRPLKVVYPARLEAQAQASPQYRVA
jgi:hypothetical protein